MQEKLRVRVKKLKVFQGVSYGELAELMEIGKSSFYNWVNGQYSLSSARADRLIEILDTLEEWLSVHNSKENYIHLNDLGFQENYIITESGSVIDLNNGEKV